MAKQATVKVHVWATKHKGKDKWRVAVDRPGRGGISYLQGNYVSGFSARRGGRRNLKAYEFMANVWCCDIDSRRYFIDFINAKPAK